MRRIKSFGVLIAILILFLSVVPFASTAAAAETDTNTINSDKVKIFAEHAGDTVNLYKGDTGDSGVLAEIPDNTEVTRLEKGTDYTYIKFVDSESNSFSGYVNNVNVVEVSQADVFLQKREGSAEQTDGTKQSAANVPLSEGSSSSASMAETSKNTTVSQQEINQDNSQGTDQVQASSGVDTKQEIEKNSSASASPAEEDKDSTVSGQTANSGQTASPAAKSIQAKSLVVSKSVQLSNTPALKGAALQNQTHVYSEASTSSSVLKNYSLGKVLQYKEYNSSWYICTVYIDGKETIGYINVNDVGTITTDQQFLKGIGVKNPTEIYSNISTGSNVLKSYSQGTVLAYKTYIPNWYACTVYIKNKAVTGYIKVSDTENTIAEKSLQGIALKSPTQIYTKASTSSGTLKSYGQGTVLHYQTFTQNWYTCTVYVHNSAVTGYMKVADTENTIAEKSLRGIALKGPTRIYTKASTSSSTLKSFAQGTVLSYQTFTQNWDECTVYVNDKEETGYIRVSDVENSTASPEAIIGIAAVTPTNVYLKASRNSSILKSYHLGSILKYNTLTSNWFECTVMINGLSTTGYINASDVKLATEGVVQDASYNLTLAQAVSMQMNASPQTDLSGSWGTATADQVEYYMNPGNFAPTTPAYYQFLNLSQPAGTDANEVNQYILAGQGVLEGEAQAFITAAQTYDINEIYLMSHALLETGNGTSPLATGVVVNGVTVYNMYGIGAVDQNPEDGGAQYAYDHGWTSIDKAIIGGAQFVAQNYISQGQDTLYKMRWNPAGMEAYGYAIHQYASDIGWAYKQTSSMEDMYSHLSVYSLLFDVPNYS